MGAGTLAQFYPTLNFIRKQDWSNAAVNLRQSARIHQVGATPDQRRGADVAVLANTANPQDILAA